MVCPTGTQGMAGKTISEKILSAKAGVDARAGDVVVCRVDCAMGTDGSAPMAIDYFEAMGGGPVRDAARMVFALDHYAPLIQEGGAAAVKIEGGGAAVEAAARLVEAGIPVMGHLGLL